MELRNQGDSLDWFFLAMCQQQFRDREKALHWYDRAADWMDKNQPANEELRGFRAEAVELLKFDEAEVHFLTGSALTRQAKWPEAAAEYRQAVRLRPDWAQAHSCLGYVLFAEAIGPMQALGAAVALAGVVLAQWASRPRPTPARVNA